MNEWLSALFFVLGAFFMFLAGLGVFRFPDLYSRMHAATKAASFGIGLMLFGFIIYHFNWHDLIESTAIIFYIFITAPVAAHMIGRAGYLLGVKQYEGTIADEMKQVYTPSSLNDSADA